MLHYELMTELGIVVLRPDGPLAAEDFGNLTRDVDAYLQKQGKLHGLMIEAHRFPGWDSFGALISHLRFVKDHHRRIERIAAVSDAAFSRIGPAVAKHFVKAEIRHFDEKDRAVALEWVKGGAEEGKKPKAEGGRGSP
jgi:hypothetical protein